MNYTTAKRILNKYRLTPADQWTVSPLDDNVVSLKLENHPDLDRIVLRNVWYDCGASIIVFSKEDDKPQYYSFIGLLANFRIKRKIKQVTRLNRKRTNDQD